MKGTGVDLKAEQEQKQEQIRKLAAIAELIRRAIDAYTKEKRA